MSYTIHYGPQQPVTRRRSVFGMIGAVLVLLVCAAAVGCGLPEELHQLRQALFPWSEPVVREAFAEFTETVSRGEPFKDAAVAFCQGILNEAEAIR